MMAAIEIVGDIERKVVAKVVLDAQVRLLRIGVLKVLRSRKTEGQNR